MPTVYFKADEAWIQEKLEQFSSAARNRIVALYADVYQAAFDEEPVTYRKENRARHEANTRLRIFVTRHARSAQGLTEKPPLSRAQTQIDIASGKAEQEADREWREDRPA